jgi:hypothetical protein
MDTFELRKSENFWRINLDQTVGIHHKNVNLKDLTFIAL